MRWWYRQALVAGRDHALAANEIRDGDVCCVTAVAMSHDVGCGRLREATAFNRSSKVTPCQVVSSFDHLVTQ